MDILWFAVCATVIFFTGQRLASLGVSLARQTGVSRHFVGGILIAVVTSVPELMSSLSAAYYLQAPDLAFGNVYGSNAFNLMLLALIEWRQGRKGLGVQYAFHHRRSGWAGVIVTAYTLIVLISARLGWSGFLTGWISGYSWGLMMLYLVIHAWMNHFHSREMEPTKDTIPQTDTAPKHVTRRVLLSFVVVAVLVMAAGYGLSASADSIAVRTGIGRTFTGTFLLAIATSLPELTSVVGAIKINASDLAVSNLFGSNLFNLLIIAGVDLVTVFGSVYLFVQPQHAVSAAWTLLMIVVALKDTKHQKRLHWNRMLLVPMYGFFMAGLYWF